MLTLTVMLSLVVTLTLISREIDVTRCCLIICVSLWVLILQLGTATAILITLIILILTDSVYWIIFAIGFSLRELH